jgi:hypothetical protein
MNFLGPMDLMRTLGSTNKQYRELAKSDILWQQFSSRRSHSQMRHAMISSGIRNKQHDFGNASMNVDGLPNSDNQPRYRSQAAISQIKRIRSWVQAFQNNNSNDGDSSYESYKRLHAEKYWPGSRHFIGRIYCRQKPDPILEADCLDGGWMSRFLVGGRSKNDCRCRTTVHCQWPGCGVGYCNNHTEKTAWETEDSTLGEKWNRCTICHLDLCHECNERQGEQIWIEPRYTSNGVRQSVCVDCRKNFP